MSCHLLVATRFARLFRLFFLLVALLGLVLPSAYAAPFSDSVQWLAAQQASDGSFTSINTSVAAATPEAGLTLLLDPAAMTAATAAAQWQVLLPSAATDELARALTLRARLGLDVVALTQELISRQGEDGGFGSFGGFSSDAASTATALIALADARSSNRDVIEPALAWLTLNQAIDGAYFLYADPQKSVWFTALASEAMQRYRFLYSLGTPIAAANEFLRATLQAGVTPAWLKAQMLVPLLSFGQRDVLIDNALVALRTETGADGSWDADVYTTALAARALYLADNAQPAEPVARLATLSGRVVSAADNQPLAGATIAFSGTAVRQVIAQADGSFSITDVPAGGFVLSYAAVGYAGATQNGNLSSGSNLSVGTAALTPLPTSAVLSGVVRAAATGLVVVGAQVLVDGAVAASTTTDATGAYRLVIAPGDNHITVTATGYENVTASAPAVVAGSALSFSPQLTAVGAPAPTTIGITGRIVDADTGAPIPGAVVASGSALVSTASDGFFALDNLVAGLLSFNVTANGYTTSTFQATLPEQGTSNLGDLRLSPTTQATTTTVAGTVSAREDGTALAGVSVTIVGTTLAATTAADGSYQIEGLAASSAQVAFRKDGYLASYANISMTGPTHVQINAQLEAIPATGIVIEDLRSTSGTVQEAFGEVELESVLVNTAATSQDVRLFITVIDAAGTVVSSFPQIEVSLGGDPASALVHIDAGANTHQDVEWYVTNTLPGSYEVRLQVFDAAGAHLLAERSVVIDILPTTRIAGHVAFDPPLALLAAQQPVSLRADISNGGNVDLENIALQASVYMKTPGPVNTNSQGDVSSYVIDERFSSAVALDRDAAGNVYVLINNGNVLKIATDKSISTVMVTAAQAASDLDVLDDGTLYVLDSYGRLHRRLPDGTTTTVATGRTNQRALKVLDADRVLLSYGAEIGLYQFSTGIVTTLVQGGIGTPRGIAIADSGDIFIAGKTDNRIYRYSQGRLSPYVNINQPHGLVALSGDRLLVTSFSQNALIEIAADRSQRVITSALSGPTDVRIGTDGLYYVLNRTNSTLVKVDDAGNITTVLRPSLAQPVGVALDASGQVVVANDRADNVVRRDGPSDYTAISSGAYLAVRRGADGELYGLTTSGIYRLVPGGAAVRVLGTWTGSARTFAPAPDGSFYVGLSANTLLHVSGGAVTELGNNLAGTVYSIEGSLSDGALVAASSGLYRLQDDGSFTKIGTVASPFILDSVSQDPRGDLWYMRYSTRQLYRYAAGSLTGTLVATVGTTGSFVGMKSLGADGVIAASSTGLLFHIDDAGVVSSYHTLSKAVTGRITSDVDGNLWLPVSGGVVRLTPAKVETFFTVTGAVAVTRHPADGVLVSTPGKIVHLSSTGTKVDWIAGSPLPSTAVSSLGIDGNGRLWAPVATRDIVMFSGGKVFEARWAVPADFASLAVVGSDLFVADNTRVARFLGSDKLLRTLAVGFNRLAPGDDGQLYGLSSASAARIDTTSGASVSVASGFTNLRDLAAAADGTLYLIDFSNNSLRTQSPAGVELETHIGLIDPKSILPRSDGSWILANGVPDALYRYAGSQLTLFNATAGFEWLADGGDGKVLAMSPSRIFVLSTTGAQLNLMALGGFGGVVRDSSGRIWAARSNELGYYDTTNTYQRSAVGVATAYDIGLWHGRTLLADTGSNAILELLPDGSLQIVRSVSAVAAVGELSDGRLLSAAGFRLGAWSEDGSEQFSSQAISSTVGDLIAYGEGHALAIAIGRPAIFLVDFNGPDPVSPGQLVYSGSATLAALPVDTASVPVNFPGWVPTASGDYEVHLTAAGMQGDLVNNLHVGAQAEADMTLAREQDFPGDRHVGATWHVTGTESTSIVDLDPQNITLATSSGGNGRAVAADTQGNIYVSDSTSIIRITPDGIKSVFASGIPYMGNGMAVDSQNRVYAFSGANLYRFLPDGTRSTLSVLPSAIGAIAIDYADRLYVAHLGNRLVRISETGEQTVVSSLGLNSPRALTIDRYGTFYVLNSNHHIYRIAADGSAGSYYDKAQFEFEGVNLVADCANNLLFAPTYLPPFKPGGEENMIIQLVGDTGEARLVLDGLPIDPALGDMDVLYYDRFNSRLLVWTDRNDGKVFSFPVVCGGIDVDLHLVTRTDVDLESASPAPAAVLPRADGSSEYVWSLTDVDQRGFDITLNWLFEGMDEGERRKVATEAFLEFSNTFKPGERIRVPVALPELMASSSKELQLALDAQQYAAQTPVNATVSVVNHSDQPFDGQVRVAVVDADSIIVEELPAITVSNLAGFGTATLPAPWNTAAFRAGPYRLMAMLIDTAGRTVGEAVADLQILGVEPGASQFAGTLVTDKPVYEAFDRVLASARIRNTSTNADSPAAVATIVIRDPAGNEIGRSSETIPAMTPEGRRDVEADLPLIDVPAGTFSASLNVNDNLSGALLTTATANFTVTRSAFSALSATASVQHARLYAGTTNRCTFVITNVGAAAATGIVLHAEVLHITGGSALATHEETVDLAGGSSHVLAFDTPATLQQGSFACRLTGLIGGATRDLAAVAFDVLSPPVVLGGSVTAAAAQVHRRDPQVCTYTASNSGAGTAQDLRIDRTLIDPNGVAVATQSDTVTLAGNASRSFVQSYDTMSLPEGNYLCRLETFWNNTQAVRGEVVWELLPPVCPVPQSAPLLLDTRDDLDLIVNGSFEEFGMLNQGATGTFPSIPGWDAKYGPLEIQTTAIDGVPQVHGDARLELDSQNNSEITQQVPTDTRGRYELVLSYSPRAQIPGTDTNNVEIWWDGQRVQTLGGDTQGWREVRMEVTASKATTPLTLRATGKSDQVGGLIDQVRLTCIACRRANLINNASFERHPRFATGNSDYFSAIPGWRATTAEPFEVQHDGEDTINVLDGHAQIELDGSANATAAQDVLTAPGGRYGLDLFYAPRVPLPHQAASNLVEIWWAGQQLDTLQGDKNEWYMKHYAVTATGNTSRLEFRGAGASDTFGGVIDNVQLSCPLPAGPNLLAANFTATGEQTIATESGRHYTLRFRYSPQAKPPAGTTNTVEVWWGNQLLTTLSGTKSGWQQKTFELDAVGTATRVAFIATGRSDGPSALIDSVNLTAEPPLPHITSTPIIAALAGEPWEYALAVENIAADDLHLTLEQAPTGMTLGSDAVLRWEKPIRGEYPVRIRVDDGCGGTSVQSFTLTVSWPPWCPLP